MRGLRRLKIGPKLALGFSVMMLFMGAIGVAGYTSIRTLQRHLDDIFMVELPSMKAVIEMDRDLQQLVAAERTMINVNPTSEHFQHLLQTYESKLQQADARWQQYKALAHTAAEQATIAKYEQTREAWQELSRQVVEGRRADTRQGLRLALDLTLGAAKDKFEEMRTHMAELEAINVHLAKSAHTQAATTYRMILRVLVLITGGGLLAGVLLAWVIGRSITKPLTKMTEAAGKIAQGDINQDIVPQSGDETGMLAHAFRALIDYIQGIANAAEALGRGDLSVQVRARSEEDLLSKNFVRVIATLQRLIVETRGLVQASRAGQLTARSDATTFAGAYRELVQDVNDMLNAVGTPLQEAALTLERVATRDLQVRMQGAYEGEYARLALALNTAQ